MKKWYETKIGAIENKYGTPIFNMALSQFFSMGIERCLEMTKADIEDFVKKETERQEEQKKNGSSSCMTPEFQGTLLSAAKEIAECSLFNDIIPYIRMYMTVQPQVRTTTVYQEDMTTSAWEILTHELQIDEDKESATLHVIADDEEEV